MTPDTLTSMYNKTYMATVKTLGLGIAHQFIIVIIGEHVTDEYDDNTNA